MQKNIERETVYCSEKGTKIVAKTFFQQLKKNGFSLNQILSISTELIGLISNNLINKNNNVFS